MASPEMLWKKGADFEDHFDPTEYLEAYFTLLEKDSFHETTMNDFHDYFSQSKWYIQESSSSSTNTVIALTAWILF